MKEQYSRFYIELPKCVAHLEVKLDMCIENGDSLSNITAEIVDDGGGAFLKLTMPEAVVLDPEELRDLTNTLLDVCRFMDERKEPEK